jgi:hypothetical protein
MTTDTWMEQQQAIKPVITLDKLCKDMGVDTLEDFMDYVARNDETYHYAYKYAVEEEGKSEEEAIAFAMEAEEKEQGIASDKYMDAVMSVARELYEEHELILEEDPENCLQFNVVPKNNWRSSLDCIRHTINGYGMFEFDSVDCLLESGPYTELSAVMQHLHWIADYPLVCGNGTAKYMVERRMRY